MNQLGGSLFSSVVGLAENHNSLLFFRSRTQASGYLEYHGAQKGVKSWQPLPGVQLSWQR